MSSRLLLGLALAGAATATAGAASPADSVVQVFASVRYPNPIRPWVRSRATEVAGSGVVLAGNKILTNAHLVNYASEVQVQAGPGGAKVDAKVEAVGPDIDLAVLTVADKKFFEKHPPLARAAAVPKTTETVEVYGFPVGGTDLSVTKGVVSRIAYSPVYSGHVGQVIQISAAVNPGNSGGPAVVAGKMVGVVFGRLPEGENISYVIPNEEIDLFLEDVKDGRYDGKLSDATWTRYQRLENESLRAWLKLDGPVRGLLASPPPEAGAGSPFEEYDILTRVGEHDIDNEGMSSLKDGMRIPFMGLITRLARGGAVPITVLRKGKRVGLSLPVTTRDTRLIREFRGEQPSYFIHGPMVFSSVKEDAVQFYFRMNPALMYSRSPLVTRRNDRASFPDEELVVVTAPLFEHKFAKGYQDPVGQVVTDVNGQKVKNLNHLVELLRDSREEFLKFRFAEQSSEVMLFRRVQMDKVTREILEDNGIAESRRGSEDVMKVWNKPGASKKE